MLDLAPGFHGIIGYDAKKNTNYHRYCRARDEDKLANINDVTHIADDAAAIRFAAIEYMRYIRRQQLKAASGHVGIDVNWADMGAAELRGTNGA